MCGDTATNESTAAPARNAHHTSSPYKSVGDFLSNLDKFQIIESTLREGEQFANAYFDTGNALPVSYKRLALDW